MSKQQSTADQIARVYGDSLSSFAKMAADRKAGRLTTGSRVTLAANAGIAYGDLAGTVRQINGDVIEVLWPDCGLDEHTAAELVVVRATR